MKNLFLSVLVIFSLTVTGLTTGSNGSWKTLTQEEFYQHEWNQVVLLEAQNAINTQFTMEDYTFQKVEDIQFQFQDGMKLKLILQYSNPEEIQRHFNVELFSQPWNKIVQITSVKEIETLKSFMLNSFQKGPGIQLSSENILDKIMNPFSKFINVTEPSWEKVSIINEEPLVAAQEAVQKKYNPQQESFTFNQVLSQRQNFEAYNYILQYNNENEVRLYEVLVAKSPETNDYHPLICQFITQLNGTGKNLRQTGSGSARNGGWTVQNKKQFMQQNSNVLPIALQAIDTDYNPEADGFEFDNVILIQEQVVAGMNFKITVEYSNGQGQIQIYDVVVYDMQQEQNYYFYQSPWQNSLTVTSCDKVGQFNLKPEITNNSLQENSISGGWTSLNPTSFQNSNSDIINVANQAIEDKYDPEAEGYTFSSVVQVKKQVVAGTNYAIEIQYSNQDGDYQYYNVIVYDCPWEKNGMTVTSCQQVEPQTQLMAQNQEQMSGGWTPANPRKFSETNSNVIGVAQQAVNEQYDPEASGYQYIGVSTVNEQVVAGMNYDVVLVYENSEGQKEYFNVVVYEVPWTSSIQVTSCTQLAQPPSSKWQITNDIPETVIQNAKQAIRQKYNDGSFKNILQIKQQNSSNYDMLLQYDQEQYQVVSYFLPNTNQSQTVLCFKMNQ